MHTPAAPAFFAPGDTPETRESVYAGFAKMCGVRVPPLDQRVFSIVFAHDGEVWRATVGETMRGTKYPRRKIKGVEAVRGTSISDPALVLAIFSGSPFMVVTNHGLVGNVGSRWANPFLVGDPTTVVRFAVTPP